MLNGEEVPEKIKYECHILKYDKSMQDYMGVSKTGSGSFLNYLFTNYQTSLFINNEVEIIEDEDINIQDIEKLDKNLKINDLESPFGINEEIIWTEIIKQHNKINDLIKAVKKLDKEINRYE